MKYFALIISLASINLFAAAPFVYQAKAVRALLDDNRVLLAFHKVTLLEDIRLKANLGFDLIGNYKEQDKSSKDYGKMFRCNVPVQMKLTNTDPWNPTYGVKTVGTESCWEIP